MEDDLKKNKKNKEDLFFFEKLKYQPQKNGRQPQKKWKKNIRRHKKK